MNLKSIFIILALLGSILITIGLYQQKKNYQAQQLFQQQQEQYQLELEKKESEIEQQQQLRQNLVNQQRDNTFKADSPNHALSVEQKNHIAQNQITRFCDMHKTYTRYLVESYLNDDPLPNTESTSDPLEQQFLDGVLARLNGLPRTIQDENQKTIMIDEFSKSEFVACIEFFEKLKESSNPAIASSSQH